MGILKNKNCFISGATGGLGVEIADRMASNKCNLFLTGRESVKLEKLKRKLESKYNVKVFYTNGDLNRLSSVGDIIRNAKECYDKIDIVINSCGVFPIKSTFDINYRDYEECFNINFRAPMMFSSKIISGMKKQKWGRIVNIGSSSSYIGYPDTSLYCASKHALLGFTRSLYKELKKYNIRVIHIAPDGMKTEMGKIIPGNNYHKFLNPKEVAKYIEFAIKFDNEMIPNEIKCKAIAND